MSVFIKAFCIQDFQTIMHALKYALCFLTNQSVMRCQPATEAQETHHKHDTAVFYTTYLKLIPGFQQQFLLI